MACTGKAPLWRNSTWIFFIPIYLSFIPWQFHSVHPIGLRDSITEPGLKKITKSDIIILPFSDISNHMFKIPDILWASEQGLTIFLNTKVVILIGRNFWEILEHVVPSHYVHEFDTNMMSSVTHLVALANKAIHKIMPKDLIDATTKSLPECVQAIINSKGDRSKYWQGTFTVFRLFHGSISFWAFW